LLSLLYDVHITTSFSSCVVLFFYTFLYSGYVRLLSYTREREEKRRYENMHRAVEVTPKGNEKKISSATKVISDKDDIIQG
jgi:hypothetical protein